MLSALQSARKHGATIVGINPLREAGLLRFRHPQHPWEMFGKGTELCTYYYQVHIGGDGALFQALNKFLLEEEARKPGSVVDQAYIDAKTEGYAAHREVTLARDLE